MRSRTDQRHRKHERSPRLLRRSVSSETGKAHVENDASQAPYQDPFVAEDARTVAKLVTADSEFPVSLAACTAPAGGAVLMDLAKPGAGAQQQRAKAIRPHLSRFIGPAYLPLKGWPSFG